MAAASEADVNNLFVFICAILVFFMHTGFAMLEAGGVQAKNRQSILIKNVMLIATSALSWWIIGYQINGGGPGKTGTDHAGWSFIGQADGSKTSSVLAETPVDGETYIGWFFGFAFAATAATIVSGAVAERTHFRAYIAYSAVLTAFVYPVVAYWVWNGNGWLLNAGDVQDSNKGYQDFAGSGAVHMVGGAAGLVGAILVGPRKFMDDGQGGYLPRFGEDGTVNTPYSPSSSVPFGALGTLILWVGWYGFNPGSAFAISGTAGGTVGLAMVNTTLAASSAAFAYFCIGFFKAEPDLSGILNSALGGLVAITANCNCVESWAAVVIGLIAGAVYISTSRLLKSLQIDDVIDAIPVHFFCGLWGVLSTGLFAATRFQGKHEPGLFYGSGQLLLWQCIGAVAITAWTMLITGLCLGGMHYMEWLRISEEEEKMGLDAMCAKYGIVSVNTPESPSQKKRQLKLAEGKPMTGLDIESGPKDLAAPVEVGIVAETQSIHIN